MKLNEIRMNRCLTSLLACAIVVGAFLWPFTNAVMIPDLDAAGHDELILNEQDNGRRIELKEGQVLVISLKGNLSTGYLWEIEQTDETIVREVDDIEFEPESNLLGAPGILTRRFEVVGPGQTDLVLVYRRPWQEGEPAGTFSIQVRAVGPFTPADSISVPVPAPVSALAVADSAAEDARSVQALPSSFNWCDQGGCTSVKDQDGCGSCWAFATVGPFESLIKLNDGVERDLAEQYLLSCNTDGWDCDGGWWAHDYHQWKKPPGEPDAGAVYEADFPYVASEVPCNPPHTHHEKIESWAHVDPLHNIPSVAKIRQAIYDRGPVAVALCAGPAFAGYSGGVFQTDEASSCGSDQVNHGVVLVGWDDDQQGGIWYLRNSWGPGWGENGYMRIKYGTSNVGYDANYVVYGGGSPPNAPSNLQATPAWQTQINLSWTDNSTSEDGFRVERSPNGVGAWMQIASVGANVTAYANTGLTSSTTYYYRVLAHNAIGDSSYSNVAHATTFGEFTSVVYLPLVARDYGASGGWTTIVSEDFEGSFPGSWDVFDGDGTSHGEYYWDKRNCQPYAGGYSGWAVGGGAGGGSLSCGSDYPNYADSWMVYGPFSLADASAADLSFKLWLNSEKDYDRLCRGASTDGSNYYGWCTSGNPSGWIDRVLDLAAVPTLGDLTGESSVWIALVFDSDYMITEPEGAHVDDILLRKHVGTMTASSGEIVAADPATVHEETATFSLER